MAEAKSAGQRAEAYLATNPLFLSAATTGLGATDQLIEIAVLNAGGVVFHSLVRPTVPISPEGTAIHGITEEDVKDAPTFAEIERELYRILHGATVVIYDVDCGVRMLRQTGAAHGLSGTGPRATTVCAMLLYAEYRGDWDEHRKECVWYKLEAAADQCGLETPEHPQRALANAELTRRLMMHMAMSSEDETEDAWLGTAEATRR